MANKHRGEIEAEIGGARRTLMLTLGALAELEAAFGADDLVALTERFGAGRLKALDLIRILGAGLRGAGAGYGVKTLEALSEVVAFFEERRGMLYGFRWRDRLDHMSGAGTVMATDQVIGAGDGTTTAFQLAKTYGSIHAPYQRPIVKPVTGSVRVAVDGVEKAEGTDFSVDTATAAACGPARPWRSSLAILRLATMH